MKPKSKPHDSPDCPCEPCGNEDCDACYPLPRWTVRTVTVRRIAHEREIKAATRDEALRIYEQGTAWPSSYDESDLEVLEEHAPSVAQVTDEEKLEFHRTWNCHHRLTR